jgi:hypothetical protein
MARRRHAAFTNGSISAWSHASPGTYPAVAIGVSSAVDDVVFRGVAIGAGRMSAHPDGRFTPIASIRAAKM